MSDFEFDFANGDSVDQVDTQWKSKSFCTPGCVTGILQTCVLQSATCTCPISK
ncbi:gallidermin/nisin family lantibiotic [uncultured Corynebacterium sp.]|uniref:gallidermin/nisin family lantibiotic n=1 Tax=uncultured Corynebacterium sp. TaxID=159447 RepID=UPI0028053C2C|nr:gallidermin/nisin family lantibiotic [uncultured Corynebacterium sp.]